MAKPSIIRVYLTAKSRDEVIKKQLEYASARGAYVDYEPPVKVGGVYEIWFREDFEHYVNTLFLIKSRKKRGAK